MNPVMYAIVGTIAVIGLLMVLFMGGATSSNQAISPERANTLATSMLSDSSRIGDGIGGMLLNGVSPGSVLFNGAENYGATTTNPSVIDDTNLQAYRQIFSPTFGRMVVPKPNNDIFVGTTATNQRVYLFRLAVVRTSTPVNSGTALPDLVMIAPMINEQVCRQVNRIMAGTAVDVAVPDSGLTLATITAGTTPQLSDAGTSIGNFTVPASAGYPQTTGCVIAGAGNYLFYRVIASS